MKKSTFILLAILLTLNRADARWFDGMYVQWGYNTEWYTPSTIHFKMSNGDNFKLVNVKAHDRPDMGAIFSNPTQISIPQYNYRVGLYLNEAHSKLIELNFDHAKYIVTDYQQVRVKGRIGENIVDEMRVMNPATFLHFEHTDGANWLHLNYGEQHNLLATKNNSRSLLTYIWKAGAGINIPRTDITWQGERMNNKFHVAGYNVSAEGGARLYPLKHLFFEGTAKTGFVHYLDALANTSASSNNKASHHFGYLELIATVGVDINFRHSAKHQD